jgi:hypothetical protein
LIHDQSLLIFCFFSTHQQGGISVSVGPVELGLAKSLVSPLWLAVSVVILWSMGAAVSAS